MFGYQRWLGVGGLTIGLVFAAQIPAAEQAVHGEQSPEWFGAPDDYEAPWKESESALPVAPLEENLTALTSDRLPDGYEYVIDRNSLSLQADQVFRYTVVIKTPSGISNGFYEGIHCETRKYKTYGYLTETGFHQSVSSAWQDIAKTGLTIHRAVLLDEIVCAGHTRPASLETINVRLEQSGDPSYRKPEKQRDSLSRSRS